MTGVLAPPTSLVDAAAVGAATILAAVAVLQLSLVLGAPWGAHVYGGRAAAPGAPLPARYRLTSLVAIGLLLGAGWLVLTRAGVVAAGVDPALARRGTWVVAGYLVLNTAANLASTSAVERRVQGSATAVAAVLTLVVAWPGPAARGPAPLLVGLALVGAAALLGTLGRARRPATPG